MDNNADNIVTMGPEQIQNYQQMLLDQVFAQRLQQNEEQIKMWNNYKNRHKKVIEGLQVFPLSVSENCMVPIGKRALMKGKLVHTNEILVCLGDGYFAKYSASQAIALCNRRIAWADEMLKSFEAERDLYEMRQIFQHTYNGEQDKNEILEYWNEDKLDEWRVRHRQRQREYHQKLTDLRKKEKTDILTEEDLFKRLDELELEEELKDEMCRLETERKRFYGDDLEEGKIYAESEESDSSDSDEITEEMLEEELKKLKDIEISKSTGETSNILNSDKIQDAININTIENTENTIENIIENIENMENIENTENTTENVENKQSNFIANSNQEELRINHSPETKDIFENTDIKKKRRVSFVEPCSMEDQNNIEDEILISQKTCFVEQDTVQSICNKDNSKDDDDTIRIEFSHSSCTQNIPESNNMEVQSPVDIYKMFINVPKSILKRSSNDMAPNQIIPPINDHNNSDTEDEVDPVQTFTKSVVIKDVQEVIIFNKISEKKDEKKTISRFKMARAGIKK